MYDRDVILQNAKNIVSNADVITPFVVIGQPRRDLNEKAAQYFQSNLVPDIDLTGYSHGYINIGGEKVDVARNYIMEACMDSHAKYLFFIGEDTVIPYDGFTKLLNVCETSPGSIAVGVYYMKLSNALIMEKVESWLVVADVSPSRKPFPIYTSGMDAMLIPLDILRKIKADEPANPFCAIINNITVDGTYIKFIGEDNYFCHRMERAGIPIICDPSVQCLHMDLATGKYTAHPDIDLDNYSTQIPVTERLTAHDRIYIEQRWSDRVPKGGAGKPMIIQIQEEFDECLKYVKDKKLILEIGTLQGGTLYQMLQVADAEAEIISLDLPYGGWGDGTKPPDINLMQSWKKEKQKLHIIRDDSHSTETLNKVMDILHGRKFDFVFIDGDHSYEGVKADYEMYGTLSTGIVAFHDILHNVEDADVGVDIFWEELVGNKREIIFNPLQGKMGIGILEVNNDGND